MTNPWAWREVNTYLQLFSHKLPNVDRYRAHYRRRWHGWEWKVVGEDFRATGFESSKSSAEWQARTELRDVVISAWAGKRDDDLAAT